MENLSIIHDANPFEEAVSSSQSVELDVGALSGMQQLIMPGESSERTQTDFQKSKFCAKEKLQNVHGTRFTKKGRQSASGEGKKPPGIYPGATTIVAPKSVGSGITNGQMKAIS
jgi:hypothetical protein